MEILHRFTPPTCTLEIWGNNYSLSRWTKRTAIKDLGFQLSFDDPRTPEEEQVTISGDCVQLEQIYNLVLDYTENFLQSSFPVQALDDLNTSKTEDISRFDTFSAQKLVNYELPFGDIVTTNSTKKIKLSALQLFDLVSALEEYKSEIAAISELEEAPKRTILPLWTKIAAGLILCVGLTNVVFQLTKNPTVTETASSQKEKDLQELEPLANAPEVVAPEIAETEVKPTPEPKETEQLSSASKLPPPPAIDLPKPPPDIPNPENFPLPEVGRTVAPEISSFPDLKPPPLERELSDQSDDKTPQVESKIVVPEAESKPTSLAIPTAENTDTDNTENNVEQQPKIALNPEKTIDDYIRDRLSRERLSESATEESNRNNNFDLTAQKPNSNISEITQTKEVKSYFDQKWQPPAELTSTLQYRLVLNKNGSLKRIIPIGKASEVYIDRTNLPLRGENFVSPLKNQEEATIRLILDPDGNVKTFLE